MARSYFLVTLAYWAFTLTDGALRMLVLLHFHTLGFTPVQLAFLFLLYEFCGILTNLLGGWAGARFGLRATLYAGLATQIIALLMLSGMDQTWSIALSVAYVMASQALSGIAKDLTKMSSKSAVKLLAPASESGGSSTLYQWVSLLTGSKNALKGVGFFLGGLLLATLGFQHSLWAMAGFLVLILLLILCTLREELGKAKKKVKFTQLFSKSPAINRLSIARIFLFAARDVWFVVGVPIFLHSILGWSFTAVGTFMALWVIGYGVIQALTPKIARIQDGNPASATRSAIRAAVALTLVTLAIAAAIQFNFHPTLTILGGLAVFGFVFALNSALHSYLILAFSTSDQVTLNVGFYYMANATGRLLGTLLSGLTYTLAGLPATLWTAAALTLLATLTTLPLKRLTQKSLV